MTDRTWLEGLQVGDEVGVQYKLGAVVIVRVQRISPKGRIIANGMQFSCSTGAAFGRKGISIVQPTAQQREKAERQKLVGKLRSVIRRYDSDSRVAARLDKAKLGDLKKLLEAFNMIHDEGKTAGQEDRDLSEA